MKQESSNKLNMAIIKPSKAPKFSNVWLIPVFSLLLGLWLMISHYLQQGPEIKIQFMSAENLTAGKTKIKILNIDVGEVTHIELNKQHDGVVVYAQLEKEISELLKEDTQFWVVKPRIGNQGVSGLETLLSGAYIELSPGKSQKAGRDFVGVEGIPLTPAGADGVHITLLSQRDRLLSAGTSITYRGFIVGRIESAKLSADQSTTIYRAFVNAPYNDLITQNTQFWSNSGIALESTAEGFELRADTLESVFSGGITFGVPEGLLAGEKIKNNHQFTLFENEKQASRKDYQYGLDILLRFDRSIRGLEVDAAVEYSGVHVGKVAKVSSVSERLDNDTIDVVIRLEPARVNLEDSEAAIVDLRSRLDEWVTNGLFASLKSRNLLTGKKYIELDFQFNKGKKQTLRMVNGFPSIPTKHVGLTQVQNRVMSVLDKVDALPLQSIANGAGATLHEANLVMKQLNVISQQVSALSKAPGFTSLPTGLDKTIQSLQHVVDGFSPNKELYQNLNANLESLNQALIEVTPVFQTLREKPNALIFNHTTHQDIEPKAAK